MPPPQPHARETIRHRLRQRLRLPEHPGLFKARAWSPFEWIVSDFGLVDAIESGLAEFPRTPTEDSTGDTVPKYRNLRTHVKKTLPKRSETGENHRPLTTHLAETDGPLKQLAGAWHDTLDGWTDAGQTVPR